MPFFEFSQNNSGGSFDYDDKSGIGETVIIEASDVDDACDRAERIGIYFNGVESGADCDCCGDRWSRPYGNGDPVPSKYGQPIGDWLTENKGFGFGLRDNERIYIHFMNGSFVKAFDFVDPVLRDLAKVFKDAPSF